MVELYDEAYVEAPPSMMGELKFQVEVKIQHAGCKYTQYSSAIRNFLRFYGYIDQFTYDGTPESFKALVNWGFNFILDINTVLSAYLINVLLGISHL